MTAQIIPIGNNPITHRICPGCNYTIPQINIEKALLNFECPSCKGFRLSDFKPTKRKY